MMRLKCVVEGTYYHLLEISNFILQSIVLNIGADALIY